VARKKINSQAKGKAAERDICDRLNAVLCDGEKLFRRSMFATDGVMFDILGPESLGWAIEVKNTKNSAIPTWWRQACRQTTKAHPRAILFYRLYRKDWQVVVGEKNSPENPIPQPMPMCEFFKWALKEMGR